MSWYILCVNIYINSNSIGRGSYKAETEMFEYIILRLFSNEMKLGMS